MTALRLTVALVALVPAAMVAQSPRTLPAPDATYDEPFTSVNVGSLRELRDGRVVVADPRDKIVQLVDFRANRGAKIGREGSGPAEFGLPMRLFTAAADTSLLFDPVNSRYLVIGPDGKPVTTFRVELTPAQASPGGGMIRMGMDIPRTADARGRLYFESAGFTMGPDGPRTADSAAIMRYDRGTQKLDTLGWVALPKNNTSGSASSGNVQLRIGMANPLTPRDEWAVFPDGRVAIVRSPGYRVDWVLANGTKQSSAPIKYVALRMGAADRKEEEALRNKGRMNQMSMMVTSGPNGMQRSAQMGPPPGAPPLEPLTDWPEVKPPFRSGPSNVVARPNGELWVRRTEAAGAKGTLYDVIDAKGAVTYQVRIGEGLALAGFGNGTVYTTKADSDDLLYLQRHRMP